MSLSTADDPSILSESWRADFPILTGRANSGQPLIYLDNAASTQRPVSVIDALRQLDENDYANVHRGIHTLSERSTEQYEQAREKVRRFINARHAHEIIFTSGTTASINTVARSWGDANVRADDEILVTAMEHHSNLVPWQQLVARTGATIRHIPITDDGFLNLEALEELLTDRTKLLAVASVSNVLGTVNPIPEIISRARTVGAKVLVDAAQSVPHMPTDVLAWDADFVAFSGHKMVGPSGVGVLYGKESVLEAMPPFLGGGSMINRVYADRFTPAELPAKFEAGTPPIGPAIGLGAAVDYLEGIGLKKIHAHEKSLIRYACTRLCEIEGLSMLGPSPEQRTGLVSFMLSRPHAHDIAQLLDRDGIAVRAGHHCAQPLHDRFGVTASTRASFYLYNTPREVDALVESIGRVQARFRPTGRKRRLRSHR